MRTIERSMPKFIEETFFLPEETIFPSQERLMLSRGIDVFPLERTEQTDS